MSSSRTLRQPQRSGCAGRHLERNCSVRASKRFHSKVATRSSSPTPVLPKSIGQLTRIVPQGTSTARAGSFPPVGDHLVLRRHSVATWRRIDVTVKGDRPASCSSWELLLRRSHLIQLGHSPGSASPGLFSPRPPSTTSAVHSVAGSARSASSGSRRPSPCIPRRFHQ